MSANGSGPGKKGIKWANEAGYSLEEYPNNTTRERIETKRKQDEEKARAAEEERAEKEARAAEERAERRKVLLQIK